MAATCSTSEDNKNLIAQELLDLINQVEYTSTVKTLKENYAVPIETFSTLEFSKWYKLDTTKCFTGKKKFKINVHCIYDIFSSYCDLDKFAIKDLIRSEIKDNWQWYDQASTVCLGWKNVEFKKWFKKSRFKKTPPDEFMLYAACAVFRRHALVYTHYQPWCTVDIKPGMSSNKIEEVCETKLLYLGDNLYDELHHINAVEPVPKIMLQDIQAARVLYRDVNLHEMYIMHVERSDYNRSNTSIVDRRDHIHITL